MTFMKYDKLKTRFQKFCDCTTLDGYKEMFYAKAKTWSLIWFIIVFGAAGVTIVQVYVGVQQFMGQSSVTQITPLDPGGLLYPPVYVCYPHWIYWVDWQKAYSFNFTKESILYALSFTTDIFSEKVFNVTEAKMNLTKSMKANNIHTISDLLKNIAMTFPMIQLSPDGLPMNAVDKSSPFFRSVELIWKTRSYFLCYKSEGDQILNLVQSNTSAAKNSRKDDNIFHFSVLDPAYSLIKDHVTYNEYNYYISFWLCKNSNYMFNRIEDFFENYTDFSLPLYMYPDAHSDNYILVINDNDGYFMKMIPTVHRWKNSRNSPCLEGQKSVFTDNSCQAKCAAQVDSKLYLCRYLDEAATLGLDDDLDKLCSFGINFLQDKFLKTFDPVNPCFNFLNESTGNTAPSNASLERWQSEYNKCCDLCDPTCEVWKYTFEVSTATISNVVKQYAFKNQTDIVIQYPQESDVLIVIQLDTQTWEDFVGNVGGLLGVWTGASILSLLQIVYLCCFIENTCNCCAKYISRKNAVQDMTSQKMADESSSRVEYMLHSKVKTFPEEIMKEFPEQKVKEVGLIQT